MKYTFETEDENEAQTLLNADKSKYVIIHIMQLLRNTIKYKDLDENTIYELQNLREHITELIHENNLPIE